MRLPLAARELARLGRSRRVYLCRTLMLGAFAVPVLLQWIHYAHLGRNYSILPEVLGGKLAEWSLTAELVLVLVVMPFLTAPLIASERRDDTLSLLLLADFRGLDIFAAKFLTAFSEAGMLLIALAPIHLLATFFGGVSPDLVVAQIVVLSAVMAYTCCLGLLCSALLRNAITAVTVTVAVLLASAFAAATFDWYVTGIGRTWHSGFLDALRLFGGDGTALLMPYRRFVVIVLALAAVLAVVTVLILPRLALSRPRRYWVGAPTPYGHTSRRLLRWGAVQPLLSMYATGLTSSLRTPAVRIIVAALLATIALVPGIGPVLVVVLLAHEVTVSLVNAHRGGVTDDLRVTVIDARQLSRDTFRFFWRRAMLYAPAILVCSWQMGLYFGAAIGGDLWDVDRLVRDKPFWGLLYAVGLIASTTLLAFAQLFAIVATGCAMGTLGDSMRRQIALTLLPVALAYLLSAAIGSGAVVYVVLYEYLELVAWLSVLVFLALSAAVFIMLGMAAQTAFRAIVERGGDSENELVVLWRSVSPLRWQIILPVMAAAGMMSMTEPGLLTAIGIGATLVVAVLGRRFRRIVPVSAQGGFPGKWGQGVR